MLLLVVSYTANSTRYTAQLRYRTGQRYADLQRVAAEFAKGSRHAIRYNPQDPSTMVFEGTSPAGLSRIMWIAGAALIMLAAVAIGWSPDGK